MFLEREAREMFNTAENYLVELRAHPSNFARLCVFLATLNGIFL